MYETYKDQIEFFIVYIREAHAIDSNWPMTFGMVEDPVSLAERQKVASTCVAELKLPMPGLVDTMDDAVNKTWKGWPDRLYLIDRGGIVRHAGGRGPFFFSPDALEDDVKAMLKKSQ